jgi:hypothetical protein
MIRLISGAAATYIIAGPASIKPFDRRLRVSQDQNPIAQMVLDELADGVPEKRHSHVIPATDAEN